METKIGSERYNNLYTESLQTGQRKQEYDGSTEEKTEVANAKNFTETAAIYEKGEAYDFGTYSVNSVQAAISESALNSKMKTYLKDLGFYNGETGGGYTEEFKKALKCFQKAYFGDIWYSVDDKVGDSLQREIEVAGTIYYRNFTNDKLTDALKKLGFGSNPSVGDKQNFARIQTFLERAMGCNKYQVAGIMGNIKQESNFRPTFSNGPTLGILQWREERRKYLEKYATKNGYSTADNMGIQLAFFRYEVSRIWGKGDIDEEAPNSELVKSWNTLKSEYKYDFYKVSDFFKAHIEECRDTTDQLRRNYSSIIYQAIS